MEDIFGVLGDNAVEDVFESANPGLNLLSLADGAEFKVGDFTFVKLGFEQGGILAILKGSLFTEKFNQVDDNCYTDSDIRVRLGDEFLPRLENEGVELLPYTMDLTALNGQTDYGSCTEMVGLLTLDLYRKYRYQIPQLNGAEWVATPFSCLENYSYVMCVGTSGSVYPGNAHSAFRYRPACIFAI